MKRHMARISMVAVAASMLGGCSSFAPIWPLSEGPVDYPGYPSMGKATCPATADKANDQLYCVQADAIKLAKHYTDQRQVIEKVKNGGILGLIGIGTAAGVTTVTQGSTATLQSLGLAAAGLIGLNSALNVDGQREVYSAGETAVGCLINLDAGLEQAAAALLRANGNTTTVFMTSLDSDVKSNMAAAVDKIITSHDNAKNSNLTLQIALLDGSATKSSFSEYLAANARLEAIQSLRQMDEASTQALALAQEIQKSAGAKSRAESLAMALSAVDKAVADGLYNNANLSKVYDGMLTGLKTVGGGTPAQAKAAAIANPPPKGTQTKAISALSPITAQGFTEDSATTITADFRKLTDNANTAAATVQAAQKVADTYDTCVAKAVSKGASPNPSGDKPGDGQAGATPTASGGS